MAARRGRLLLLCSLLWISSPAKGQVADAEVSCVYMESCILPCSFQASNDSAIDWFQMTAKHTRVHSYYNREDQLNSQDQHFRDRTSLFKDQISKGNTSLQLKEVKVQDRGLYHCYTRTDSYDQESFINVSVNALVSKVHVQQEGNRINCSSEGIYPEPELTWSTNPPSNVTFKNSTTVQQTEQQLYNINSSLIVSENITDVVYSCTVSTRRNKRMATLFKLNSQWFSDSDTQTTIPCTSTNTPTNTLQTGLIWRFNYTQIILNQTGANVPYKVSDEWKQHVKSVSESGSLTLQDLSSKQEGIYTCELSNDEETNVTNTVLRMEKSQGILTNNWIIVGLVLAVGIVGIVTAILLWYCWKKKKGEQDNSRSQATNGTTHQGIELEDLTTNGATPHQNCRNPTADPLLE